MRETILIGFSWDCIKHTIERENSGKKYIKEALSVDMFVFECFRDLSGMNE